MQEKAATAFFAINALEVVVITVGNTFAIFVFWTQRSHLKRTCVLLINLAVADLLVGITEPIVLATEKIPSSKAPPRGEKNITNPSSTFQILGSSTSVFFLALISLERVYAVLRPLHHRVMHIRVYIYSVGIVWAVGIGAAGLSVLPIYYTEVDGVYFTATIHTSLFIALLVIFASYLKICTRLRNATPELDVHNRHSLRLSRTMFLTIAVSLVFWLPAFSVYITRGFCTRCFSPLVVRSVNALHLANSMVNPFVYSFRMQIFKDALKKFWRRRRQNIEIRPAHTGWLVSLGLEGSFTPKMEQRIHTTDINLARPESADDNGTNLTSEHFSGRSLFVQSSCETYGGEPGSLASVV